MGVYKYVSIELSSAAALVCIELEVCVVVTILSSVLALMLYERFSACLISMLLAMSSIAHVFHRPCLPYDGPWAGSVIVLLG